VEPEALVQRPVVDEDGEKREYIEQLRLPNEQKPRCVIHLPMPELVCQHSLDLLLCALLQQRVEDDNLLLANPRKSSEVGVAVGAALAAVDDLQLRQRKLELRSQRLDTVLERSRLQWLELVEQRRNQDRVDGHGRDLHHEHEHPQVVEEVLPRLVDDGEEGAANWNAESKRESLALDHVREPELDRHLVEAKLLLEDEAVVVLKRKTRNEVYPSQHVHEEQGARDFAGEARGRIASDDGAGDAPDDRVNIEVEGGDRLELVKDLGSEAELGFCATICLLSVSMLLVTSE
jgi:hypothetical protein